MREEMASSSSLCVCECAFADHSLDHDRPRSLQKEQIVPLSPSLRFSLSVSVRRRACYILPLPRNIEKNKPS